MSRSVEMPRYRFLATLVMALAATSAGAQTPFYQGKQRTILNNFSPGGPNGIEARLLAKHLPRHIAGHPNVIVQDKEGAGGLVGTKFLGEVAPKDGSMVGYFTGAAWECVIEPQIQIGRASCTE